MRVEDIGCTKPLLLDVIGRHQILVGSIVCMIAATWWIPLVEESVDIWQGHRTIFHQPLLERR